VPRAWEITSPVGATKTLSTYFAISKSKNLHPREANGPFKETAPLFLLPVYLHPAELGIGPNL
jgi:hypothetical protein